MEEEKQKKNGRQLAFDSKDYTIFDALVEAMRKKEEEDSRIRRFLRRLRLSKSPSKKGKNSSKCSHHFGHLGSLPNFESIPQECLTCQEMLQCRNPDKPFLK